jgi:hypothetical protein
MTLVLNLFEPKRTVIRIQGVVRSPGFEPGSEAWQAYGDLSAVPVLDQARLRPHVLETSPSTLFKRPFDWIQASSHGDHNLAEGQVT